LAVDARPGILTAQEPDRARIARSTPQPGHLRRKPRRRAVRRQLLGGEGIDRGKLPPEAPQLVLIAVDTPRGWRSGKPDSRINIDLVSVLLVSALLMAAERAPAPREEVELVA